MLDQVRYSYIPELGETGGKNDDVAVIEPGFEAIRGHAIHGRMTKMGESISEEKKPGLSLPSVEIRYNLRHNFSNAHLVKR